MKYIRKLILLILFSLAYNVQAQYIISNNLAPNPANDFFILDYSFDATPEQASLLIYDVIGRKIDEIALKAISEQKLIT